MIKPNIHIWYRPIKNHGKTQIIPTSFFYSDNNDQHCGLTKFYKVGAKKEKRIKKSKLSHHGSNTPQSATLQSCMGLSLYVGVSSSFFKTSVPSTS